MYIKYKIITKYRKFFLIKQNIIIKYLFFIKVYNFSNLIILHLLLNYLYFGNLLF